MTLLSLTAVTAVAESAATPSQRNRHEGIAIRQRRSAPSVRLTSRRRSSSSFPKTCEVSTILTTLPFSLMMKATNEEKEDRTVNYFLFLLQRSILLCEYSDVVNERGWKDGRREIEIRGLYICLYIRFVKDFIDNIKQ